MEMMGESGICGLLQLSGDENVDFGNNVGRVAYSRVEPEVSPGLLKEGLALAHFFHIYCVVHNSVSLSSRPWFVNALST